GENWSERAPRHDRSFYADRAGAGERFPVHKGIERKHENAEDNLCAAGQLVRVENRDDVVLDESAAISCLAAKPAPMVFERRERTDPAEEFDEHAPHGGRQVDPREKRPAQNEEAAQDHEQHETEVENDDEIG